MAIPSALQVRDKSEFGVVMIAMIFEPNARDYVTINYEKSQLF